MITIQAIKNYTDNELKENKNNILILRKGVFIEPLNKKDNIVKGDIYTIKRDRAKQICDAGLAVMLYIEKQK